MTCLGSEDRSGCCVQLALLVGRKLFVGQLGSGGAVLCEGREKGGRLQVSLVVEKADEGC